VVYRAGSDRIGTARVTRIVARTKETHVPELDRLAPIVP
jgi:hypothetical protein